MKRTICILVTFIFVSNLLAQVKCIVDYPDLNVTYKRTTVSESEVTIDFLLLYCGKQPIWTTFSSATFYDDEGNMYESLDDMGRNLGIYFDLGGTGKKRAELHPDIPVKLRIRIKNVDEFATVFTKINLRPLISGLNYDINVLNVPIPRN